MPKHRTVDQLHHATGRRPLQACDDPSQGFRVPAIRALGPMALSSEDVRHNPETRPETAQFGNAGKGGLLVGIRGEAARLSPVPERRGPTRVSAASDLSAVPGSHPRSRHVTLEIREGTRRLARSGSDRVVQLLWIHSSGGAS